MASIVLLVVFALIILFVVGRYIYLILDRSADSSCTQSILKSGQSKVPIFDCVLTKEDRITISKASLESREGGKLDADGLDNAVKRAIANEMYACWKMTGQGVVDPYEHAAESSFGANVDYFLICKIIVLKDIPDFNGLLFWTTFNKPTGEDEPYFDIVYNTKPTKEMMEEFEKKEDNYSSDKEYCVVWRATEEKGKGSVNLQSIIFVPYSELIQTTYKPYYGNGFTTKLFNKNDDYFPVLMN